MSVSFIRLETDRTQLIKKERCFKYHKFEHLITDYTAKKQNVSNITEKNDTEFIMMRKKTEKK